MLRREFIKNVKLVSGVVLGGMGPLAMGQQRFLETESDVVNGQPTVPIISSSLQTRLVAEIRSYNSKPTVFVNGKAYFPMAYVSYYPAKFRYKNMQKSGIKFFSLSITLGGRFVAAYRKEKVRLDKKGIWDGPDKIDFDLLDKSIQEILEVAPNAFIFPRIFCDSPGWWDSSHPADTSRTNTGFPLRQSFSSIAWRNETAEVLRKIVQHIYRAPYADKIIGLHITAGETEESVYHDWLGPVDYSLAAQHKFRQWLIKKYKNNEVIKLIFNIKVEEISIPLPAEREKSEFGNFYDPEKSKLVIDYNIFKCEEIVETLEFFCKAVKDESKGNLLTGVFYGYTLVEWRDHLALSLLLKSPYIDFLSNTNGAGRNTIIGEHDMHFLSETNSIQKANKLFYYEADTRTCMSKWISELQPDVDPYHEYDLENWLGPNNIEKTLELLKTVFSRVVCTGSTNWWFDLWGRWYDHEKILNLFSKMQKIGDESIDLPRDSVSQICIVVSEKSLLYYATASRKTTWISQQISQIGKVGAPYDIYLLDDLKNTDISKYKIFIFLNTFLLSSEERKIIRQKCMCDNRILLWFYAPGMINNEISIANVSSLLNMEISSEEKRPDSGIDVQFGGKELTYIGAKVSPFLFIKGGATTVYGRTKDNYAVLSEKKEKDYRNILACIPPVPWQVIQYFAMKSGVHIYSNGGDIVYANQSYLSISALKSGTRLIKLPEKFRIKELLGNSAEYKSDREFKIYFPAESCRFFKLDK